MSFVRRAVAYSGASVVGQAALFVQSLVVRRMLPPEVLGIWNFTAVVRQFVMNFDPGIITAAVRDLPIAQGKGDQTELDRIRSTVLIGVGAQALMMGVGIVIYAWFNAGGFSDIQLTALHFGAALTLLTVVQWVYIAFLQGSERYVPLSKVLLLGSLLDAILLSLGAYLHDLVGLMAAALISLSVKLLLLIHATSRERIRTPLRGGMDFAKLKSLLAFGFPFRVLDYPLALFMIADLLLVTRLFSVGELALYAMGKNFVNQVGDIATRVGTVYATRLYILAGQGASQEAVAKRLQSFVMFQLLVAVPLLAIVAQVGIGFMVREIIPSYGGGMEVFRILLISMFFMPPISNLRFPLVYSKNLRQIGISSGVALGAAALLFPLVNLAASDLTLRLVAQVMLLSYVVYFTYLMMVIGPRLWSLEGTVVNIGMVLAAALWTWWILNWQANPASTFDSLSSDLVWSGLALAKALVLLLPLAGLGLWRAGLLKADVMRGIANAILRGESEATSLTTPAGEPGDDAHGPSD